MGDTRRMLQRVRVDAPHRHGGRMWCRATIWADDHRAPTRWWGHLHTTGTLEVYEADTRPKLTELLEARWAELAWGDAGLAGGCPHCALMHDRASLERVKDVRLIRLYRKRVRALEAAAAGWDARHGRTTPAEESAAA